jgi:sterol desaturase/sphingolipid hydroxylase (fatty acid hydroxylase superfamily)
MNLFFGVVLLLVMILIELLYLKYIEKEEIPWREIIFNLNSGHVMLWVCRGLEVAGFDYVLRHASLGWVTQLPVVVQWIFTLFAWDFCFYWMHRLHHKYPLLWAVHVVHHEGEHFSLSLGIRNSWYSSLTAFPFFVPLALLGVPTEQFLLLGSLHYFIQFYNHNRVINKSGWLEYFLVTPSHHRVHHGMNKEYRDKNCSGTFAIWDKLFGTFQEERDNIEIKYGVAQRPESDNPFWANHIPFFKYVFKKKISSTSFFPKNKRKVSDFVISLGGILLFALLIFYIYQEDKWHGLPKICLFSLLLLSTIAMAGLYENYRWGNYSWLFCAIGMAFFAWYFSVFSLVFLAMIGLFLFHAIGIYLWSGISK